MVLVSCSKDTFEFKNSWGEDFAYKGLFAISRTLAVDMQMKFYDVFFIENFIAIVTSDIICETEQRMPDRKPDKVKMKATITEFMEAERGNNIEAVLNKFYPLVKFRWQELTLQK